MSTYQSTDVRGVRFIEMLTCTLSLPQLLLLLCDVGIRTVQVITPELYKQKSFYFFISSQQDGTIQ